MNSFKAIPKFYKIVIVSLIVITVASLVVLRVYYVKYEDLLNPAIASQQEINKIVLDVGKYIVLPSDETPTLATVSDPEKLKGQAFFANAQTGDKVLIYTIARKAILWRPSISKIIEVSPLNVPTTTTGSETPSTVGTVKIK